MKIEFPQKKLYYRFPQAEKEISGLEGRRMNHMNKLVKKLLGYHKKLTIRREAGFSALTIAAFAMGISGMLLVKDYARNQFALMLARKSVVDEKHTNLINATTELTHLALRDNIANGEYPIIAPKEYLSSKKNFEFKWEAYNQSRDNKPNKNSKMYNPSVKTTNSKLWVMFDKGHGQKTRGLWFSLPTKKNILKLLDVKKSILDDGNRGILISSFPYEDKFFPDDTYKRWFRYEPTKMTIYDNDFPQKNGFHSIEKTKNIDSYIKYVTTKPVPWDAPRPRNWDFIIMPDNDKGLYEVSFDGVTHYAKLEIVHRQVAESSDDDTIKGTYYAGFKDPVDESELMDADIDHKGTAIVAEDSTIEGEFEYPPPPESGFKEFAKLYLVGVDGNEYFLGEKDLSTSGNETPGCIIPCPKHSGTVTEEFDIGTTTGKVDFLWILDDSQSMKSTFDLVTKGFMDIKNSSPDIWPQDYRSGLINMMFADPGNYDTPSVMLPRSVSKSTPGFLNLVDPGCGPWFETGACLSQAVNKLKLGPRIVEAGITAYEQFVKSGRADFRQDADIHVIFISDTHDPGASSRAKKYPEEWRAMIKLKNTIKKNPLAGYSELKSITNTSGRLKFHAIAPSSTENCPEKRDLYDWIYFKLVRVSGGTAAEYCKDAETDYSDFVKSLVTNAAGKQNTFTTEHEIDQIISVVQNGVNVCLTNICTSSYNRITVPGLTYDGPSTVTITYKAK